jgi:hypothetical protein
MTELDHVKAIIGDLVLTVARQAAELDALRPQPLAPAPPPAPPTEPQP